MATPKPPVPVNVVKGLRLIANAVEADMPANYIVERDSAKWNRCIEPALAWMYTQRSEPMPVLECPHCKAKLRRGTALVSHLGNCPNAPRLLRRRKPENPR